MTSIRCRTHGVLVVFSVLAFGQSGGRFEQTKRQALAYLESTQYDRAAGKLEEIWERDQSDPTVAEDLALAYLNGDDRRYHPEVETKAQALQEKAIQMGGRASFMVQHSHEKFAFVQGKTINNYCLGSLSIAQGRLVFVARARKGVEEHSFDVTANDVRVTTPDSGGAFQVRTKARNYTLVPRTRIKGDSDLIVSLIQEHVSSR